MLHTHAYGEPEEEEASKGPCSSRYLMETLVVIDQLKSGEYQFAMEKGGGDG